MVTVVACDLVPVTLDVEPYEVDLINLIFTNSSKRHSQLSVLVTQFSA